jgi:hypothetical protein
MVSFAAVGLWPPYMARERNDMLKITENSFRKYVSVYLPGM